MDLVLHVNVLKVTLWLLQFYHFVLKTKVALQSRQFSALH